MNMMWPEENQRDKHSYDRRTEEVSEIIDRMPMDFGKALMILVVGLTSVILLLGWFIQYPEVLSSQLTLSSSQAEVRISAGTSGVLQLQSVESGDFVSEGRFIAVIKNATVLEDVVKLEHLINSINIFSVNYKTHRHYFPDTLHLGELNSQYYTFLNSLYKYLDYIYSQPYIHKRDIGQKLVYAKSKLRKDIQNQAGILKSKYETSKNMTVRDSLLFKNQVISKADYEKSLLNRITAEQEFESINKEINNLEYQQHEASAMLEDLAIEKGEKERELQVTLFNAFNEMRESIQGWKLKYVLISPIDGKVDFLNFWKNGDVVQAGQEVIAIVQEKNSVIGHVFLPEYGAGKVKQGQRVIVKLDNYPYKEFGTISGNIKSVSQVSNQRMINSKSEDNTSHNAINGYLAVVEFPKGLTTSFGSKLKYRTGSQGTAEVVLEKRRLIERLFDNLNYRLTEH